MSTDVGTQTSTETPEAGILDLKLEVVVIPVSDVDRAKAFYQSLGFRLDADFVAGDLRVVQVTPPGSACSIIFGNALTTAEPGSSNAMFVVYDIAAACADLVALGAPVSEVFHDAGGVFVHAGTTARVSGADPQGRSYASFASFNDPDGNRWLIQEIKTRAPGR